MIDISDLGVRDCPVCGACAADSIPFLERRIDTNRLGAYAYASRKMPEYMSFKLVRCPECDTVYACEAPSTDAVDDAYHQAAYDSREEALDAAEAYAMALKPLLATIVDRKGVLEIGAGTGAFLMQIKNSGFADVVGVEPSLAAIGAADEKIKSNIRSGVFCVGDYAASSFSLITCFMTLEHVHDPAGLVRDCFGLLKPGGYMAVVVHDWRAWNNKLLGRYAPIIDIEHLQIFSKKSITGLFEKSGFTDIRCDRLVNKYKLEYWNRLLPVPLIVKQWIRRLLVITGLARVRLKVNAGNLILIARRGF